MTQGINSPSGYRFLGFNNGEFYEKNVDVVTKLKDTEWIGILILTQEPERSFSILKSTPGFQFEPPALGGKPSSGLYRLNSLSPIDPLNIHIIITPKSTPNNLIISSIDSTGITFQILDNQGLPTSEPGNFHVQIKHFV